MSMMKPKGDLSGFGLKKRYKMHKKNQLKEEETKPKTKMKRKTMTKIILHPEVNTLPTSR